MNSSDQAYRPMLKVLGLKVKRDFSGKKQSLENPDFLLPLITNHAEYIQGKFSRWTKTERSVYKTYFNELIKGAPGLGNTLVDKTKDFEQRVLKSRAMMDEINMQKLTIELIENGFIDEDYFYGKKLAKIDSRIIKKS